MRRWIFALLAPMMPAFSYIVGNPGDPTLYTKGMVMGSHLISLRIGAYGDLLSRQRFRDEFHLPGVADTPSYLRLWSSGGMAVLNYNRRIDLYTLLGSARAQIDHEIYTNRTFAWGVGFKWAILARRRFRVGVNAQYYQSDQKPSFFLSDGSAYNLANEYHIRFSDLQAALGFTFKTGIFAPYVNATYFHSQLSPSPVITAVRLPYDPEETVNVITKSVVSNRKWGMSVGASILAEDTVSLTVESRFLNQNGVTLSGEFRF